MKKYLTLIASLLLVTACTAQQLQDPNDPAAMDGFRVVGQSPADTDSGQVEYEKIVHGDLTSVLLRFSEALNGGTVNADTIYVLAGIDEKLPAKYSYDSKDFTVMVTLDPPVKATGSLQRFTVVAKGVENLKRDFVEDYVRNIDVQL